MFLTPNTTTALFVVLLSLLGMLAVIGLMLLEAGLVRSRNTNDVLLKNIALFAILSVLVLILGQHVCLQAWTQVIPKIVTIKDTLSLNSFYSKGLYYLVLLIIGTSIITGATAERLRFGPFISFALLMLLFIYPIELFWVWFGGFLANWHFIDQGGASVIHLNSAMASLAALLIIGARRDKYTSVGESLPLPGANIPLSALGISFIWLGFIALNIFAVMVAKQTLFAKDIYLVLTNTVLAGSAGLIVVMLFSRVVFGTVDLTLIFNGIFAGLISITASPAAFSNTQTLFIAALAAFIAMIVLYIMDNFEIDDPIGIIATQCVGSVTSLIAVAFTESAYLYQLGLQFVGIVTIATYSFVVSFMLWWLVRVIMGLRINPEDEYKGLDVTGCGMVAYPEFTATNWEK